MNSQGNGWDVHVLASSRNSRSFSRVRRMESFRFPRRPSTRARLPLPHGYLGSATNSRSPSNGRSPATSARSPRTRSPNPEIRVYSPDCDSPKIAPETEVHPLEPNMETRLLEAALPSSQWRVEEHDRYAQRVIWAIPILCLGCLFALFFLHLAYIGVTDPEQIRQLLRTWRQDQTEGSA